MINESQSPKDEAQLVLISSRGAIKLKRKERVKKVNTDQEYRT